MNESGKNQATVDRIGATRRLQRVQEKSGLNKVDFAASIGIAKSNYRMIEVGDRFLTVDQLYRLYMRYGVPIEYILLGLERDLPDRFR